MTDEVDTTTPETSPATDTTPDASFIKRLVAAVQSVLPQGMFQEKSYETDWIDYGKAGEVVNGFTLSADFLKAAAANYNPAIQEAPLILGHTTDNRQKYTEQPAWGWLSGVKYDEGTTGLKVKFSHVPESLKAAIDNRRYSKLSFEVAYDPTGQKKEHNGLKLPAITAFALLGAATPASKTSTISGGNFVFASAQDALDSGINILSINANEKTEENEMAELELLKAAQDELKTVKAALDNTKTALETSEKEKVAKDDELTKLKASIAEKEAKAREDEFLTVVKAANLPEPIAAPFVEMAKVMAKAPESKVETLQAALSSGSFAKVPAGNGAAGRAGGDAIEDRDRKIQERVRKINGIKDGV